MPRDIDRVIEKVREFHPDAKISQLSVAHPGVDDDGIWFFSVPDEQRRDIQVESSSGAAPFIIEHSDLKSGEVLITPNVEGAVSIVGAYLTKLKRRPNRAS